MSANEGFFELQVDDTEKKLIKLLKTHPAVETVKQEEEKVLSI
jgi:ABC-2 type transport system ATP-binding protein